MTSHSLRFGWWKAMEIWLISTARMAELSDINRIGIPSCNPFPPLFFSFFPKSYPAGFRNHTLAGVLELFSGKSNQVGGFSNDFWPVAYGLQVINRFSPSQGFRQEEA